MALNPEDAALRLAGPRSHTVRAGGVEFEAKVSLRPVRARCDRRPGPAGLPFVPRAGEAGLWGRLAMGLFSPEFLAILWAVVKAVILLLVVIIRGLFPQLIERRVSHSSRTARTDRSAFGIWQLPAT